MGHRFLPHTADIRVALEADSFEAVLGEAVGVVRTLLVGASTVEPRTEVPLRVAGSSAEETLLAVLREVLRVFDTEGFVPARLRCERADPTGVRATLLGEGFDPARHEPQPEVKAVTRHGLIAREQAPGWYAEIVFDV